jgi:DNA-binding transcriptional LysR family regulator
MRISMGQVEYFLAAEREGTFTGAARACGVRQPTLSQCLKELELALGGALFKRAKRGVELTALGRAVRPHLAAIARSALRTRQIARAFRQGLGAEGVPADDGHFVAMGGESAGLV